MIRYQTVSKTFPTGGGVRDLTLEIPTGKITALVGPSGSGKSTALKLVNGLLAPSDGTLCIQGIPQKEWNPIELRRSVGYVPQNGALFPHMTVLENVTLPQEILLGASNPRISQAKNLPEKRFRRATHALKQVELDSTEFGNRYPHQLSGGQKQRVAVARTLVTDPKIILLDEPFSALDPLTRKRMQILLTKLHKELGFTSIVVTHDVAEAFAVADYAAVMDRGRLVESGDLQSLANNPQSAYLQELLAHTQQQSQHLQTELGEP